MCGRLCAFAKVHLQPAEHQIITMPVRVIDLARFDPTAATPSHGGVRRTAAAAALVDSAGGTRRVAAGAGGAADTTAWDAADGAYAGAWVVDGGTYRFFAAGCVSNPALVDAHHHGDPDCPFASAIEGAAVDIGREGVPYGVFA